MAYPVARRLGDSDDEDFASFPDSTVDTTNDGGASNAPSFFDTLLTDVVQIFKPGTPVTQRVYTPTTTAAGQILGNPLVLVGVGVLAYALLSKRR